MTVEVVDSPVTNVTFGQFLATVSGKITCLEACGPITINLQPASDTTDSQVHQLKTDDGKFQFSDVLPLSYELSIVRDQWCWESVTQQVNIENEDISGVTFVQTGYQLTVSSSHDVRLHYRLANTPVGSGGVFNLNKGVATVCLPAPGKYLFSMESCHDFGLKEIKWNTEKPSLVSLSAIQHLITGHVVSSEKESDIKVKIYSKSKDNELVLGPLSPVFTEYDNSYHYQFKYWATASDELTATPQASDLLFTPTREKFMVLNDCMNDAVKFEGKKGLFIRGGITPPLPGVSIKIIPQDDLAPMELETNASGEFVVGPLPPTTKYTITAVKQGYIFTEEGRLGHFFASKLAEVVVTAVDEEGEKLSGVLVTIAGGVDYRQNSLTNKDGVIAFTELSPGEYFVRPMMKEYKFEPASKMISIQEGETVKIQVE